MSKLGITKDQANFRKHINLALMSVNFFVYALFETKYPEAEGNWFFLVLGVWSFVSFMAYKNLEKILKEKEHENNQEVP